MDSPNDIMLRRQLRVVADRSESFTTALRNHNYLPNDFPLEATVLLLSGLSGLFSGSLESCRVPLEHAGVRLSELRNDQFQIGEFDDEEEIETDPDSVNLERGDALDTELKSLLSEVSTALSAYRNFRRTEYESFSLDGDLPIVSGNPDIDPKGVVDTSTKVFEQLAEDANADEFEGSNEPGYPIWKSLGGRLGA